MTGQSYVEQAKFFVASGNRLLSIIACPEEPVNTGVLILVGGPQYRVGSHRQFTLLARSLAESGVPSMRFDFQGMGDSEGDRRSFEESGVDIAAAIEEFGSQVPDVEKIVLWGLCDAASSAMMHAADHPEVAGLVLLNPWVQREEPSPEVTLLSYYGPFIATRDNWRRLLQGRVNLRDGLKGLFGDTARVLGRRLHALSRESSRLPFVKRMAQGLQAYRHRALIVLSEHDLTAREFALLSRGDPVWKSLVDSASVEQYSIADADHTFSSRKWRQEVERLTISWVKAL